MQESRQKSSVIYDYLIVGAGLFGSVFAFEVSKRGKKCLVIDKRSHIGGNCYTEAFIDSSVDLSESSANSNLDFSTNPQSTNPNVKSIIDSHASNANPNAQTINIHKYGAHIFHTSNAKIWDYINQFCEFNHFINSPLANYKGEIYNLPFNMNTFAQIFGNARNTQARHERERELPTR